MMYFVGFVSNLNCQLFTLDFIDTIRDGHEYNIRKGVSASLYCHDSKFFQVMKGPFNAVENIMRKIEQDCRHDNISKIYNEELLPLHQLKLGLHLETFDKSIDWKKICDEQRQSPRTRVNVFSTNTRAA